MKYKTKYYIYPPGHSDDDRYFTRHSKRKALELSSRLGPKTVVCIAKYRKRKNEDVWQCMWFEIGWEII